MVDVRVLFWSITNKIYWEKILPITLYVHKIALPENVTLTYTLPYGVHEFLKVCHPLFKTLATLAMVIVSTFALKSVQPC